MIGLFNFSASLAMFPGEIAARLAGLEGGSDHAQIFRMFTNSVFWTFVGVLAVVQAV